MSYFYEELGLQSKLMCCKFLEELNEPLIKINPLLLGFNYSVRSYIGLYVTFFSGLIKPALDPSNYYFLIRNARSVNDFEKIGSTFLAEIAGQLVSNSPLHKWMEIEEFSNIQTSEKKLEYIFAFILNELNIPATELAVEGTPYLAKVRRISKYKLCNLIRKIITPKSVQQKSSGPIDSFSFIFRAKAVMKLLFTKESDLGPLKQKISELIDYKSTRMDDYIANFMLGEVSDGPVQLSNLSSFKPFFKTSINRWYVENQQFIRNHTMGNSSGINLPKFFSNINILLLSLAFVAILIIDQYPAALIVSTWALAKIAALSLHVIRFNILQIKRLKLGPSKNLSLWMRFKRNVYFVINQFKSVFIAGMFFDNYEFLPPFENMFKKILNVRTLMLEIVSIMASLLILANMQTPLNALVTSFLSTVPVVLINLFIVFYYHKPVEVVEFKTKRTQASKLAPTLDNPICATENDHPLNLDHQHSQTRSYR